MDVLNTTFNFCREMEGDMNEVVLANVNIIPQNDNYTNYTVHF